MAFPARAEYESLIYGLAQNYPDAIVVSTLRLFTRGPLTARIEGQIEFTNGLILSIREFVDLRARRILDYSYTVFRDKEKIRWYDPQPHPELPELASTFPHHRHDLPDPKNNRHPAPGITFDSPNLPTLIADCIELAHNLSVGQ